MSVDGIMGVLPTLDRRIAEITDRIRRARGNPHAQHAMRATRRELQRCRRQWAKAISALWGWG